MAHIRLVAAQLIVPAGLGPVTQRRVEAIVSALGEKVLAVAHEGSASGSAVVLVGDGLYVELTPVLVTAGFQGRQDAQLERAAGVVSDVLTATVTEATGGPVARFVAHIAGRTDGATVLDAYVTPAVRRLPGKLADAAWGVGFRYLLRTPVGRGECRIEPLVADPSWVYIEYVLASSEVVPMGLLGHFAKDRQAEFQLLVQQVSEGLREAGTGGANES